MDIVDMHLYFRELAQQSGMQTVRAILPEDIDVNLNIAIRDKVKSIIQGNVRNIDGNTKVARDNSKYSQINSLRSLYKSEDTNGSGAGSQTDPYVVNIGTSDKLLVTGFKSLYKDRIYDIRIIELEELGATLNDFCNRAEFDAPLCTITGDVNSITLDVYTGPVNGVAPDSIRYSYIKTPNVVCHPDVGDQVDCDLIEYLHDDVVRAAVNMYLKAIVATNAS